MVESSQKVSIILPTYNGSKYIRQSMDSCLNQTYKNIELIIVDDGSKDETPDIIMSYKDDRIKYIRHEKNRGLPHALNTGFEKATGEYLTWTSDDNYYANDAIKKMLNYLKNNNCELVFCDYYSFEDNDSEDFNLIKLPDNVAFDKINPVRACFLYKRKVYEVIGVYNPETKLAEDYDYWIRVSKQFNMFHLGEPLYFYRIHKKSLYSSRFYEVEVVKLLVRLKHDILDTNQTTEMLIDLIGRKKKLYKLNKFLGKIMFSKKINTILNDYKLGKISFSNAICNLSFIYK